MYTYKEIINRFKEFFEAHLFVERFTSGDFDASQIDKDYGFPHVHIQPTSAVPNGSLLNWGFRIVISDLQRVEEDKQGYIEEILHSTHQIALDFVSYLDKGDEFFKRNDYELTINSLDPYWDQLTQNCAGWTVELTLSTPFDHSICSVPLLGYTPAPPADCADASIKDSEGNTLFTVASGGTQVVNNYRVGSNAGAFGIPIESWNNASSSFGNKSLEDIIVLVSDLGNESLSAQDIVDGASAALEAALALLICSCADGSVTVNGDAFDTVASGGSLDVPVQYANGTDVGTITAGIVVIPNPAGSTIIPDYCRPMKDGISYRDYDLGWQYANGVYDRLDSERIGRIRVLGADNYTLDADTLNSFGTTARYTFDDGAQAWGGSSFNTSYGAATDYIIIDHLIEKALYVANLGNLNWDDSIDACQAHSAGGLTWYMGAFAEYQNFMPDRNTNYYNNNNPFRRGVVSGYSDFYFWTSRTPGASTGNAFQFRVNGESVLQSKTSTSIVSCYPLANYTP